MAKSPSYQGNGLVNLIADIEKRMTGESRVPGLSDQTLVPDAKTYVLVLFDGLGVAQLEHPAARSFAGASASSLEAPFPTTTSVSLATVATGLPPSQHGQVAHLTWMPDLETVVNCLKWVSLTGEPINYNYPTVLPHDNLWERMRSHGIEPIAVQPGDFAGSPLSRVLYRGARFEGVWDIDDLVTATTQLASEPNRFIFTYVPHVDFAGHVFGLASKEFEEAMKTAVRVWEGIATALPPGAALLGTADHGLIEFGEDQKHLIREPRFDTLRMAGDTRGVHLWGDADLMNDLADLTGGELADPIDLLGPDITTLARTRVGDKLLLAPNDRVLLPKGFDKRLRCYHGGLTDDEVQIPLLVG